MTPGALSMPVNNTHGGAPVSTVLWSREAIGVAGKEKGLTTKLVAQPVGTEKTQGTLATYACTRRRRPSMARPRQVPAHVVPDQPEESNSTGDQGERKGTTSWTSTEG